ncbi:MAG: DUF503 domain-containing protein [Spirochaetae bacterium HGW-Spirochaetae-1]|nr:MAG: DUF503 domain-containing protein [Spirochaetae bacterium HGW-Spirochaetae-1]
MFIGLIHMDFRLEGCRSLKEKRSRMSGLRRRFGRMSHIALCESGYQDEHMKSRWSFVIVSLDRKGLDRAVNILEKEAEEIVDALLTGITREEL